MPALTHALRLLTMLCGVSAALAWGGEVAQADVLTDGRRMLRVSPPPGRMYCLSGRAPQGGENDHYLVTNGAETLWQGGAGESFSVPRRVGVKALYLVSMFSRNNAWQELQWSEGRLCPGSKHADMGAAVKWGFLPGEADAGPALRRIISELQTNGPDAGSPVLYLKKGEYHFYPQGAQVVSLYISGHAPQEKLLVAVPLVNLQDLTLDAQGSVFIIHGDMLPLLLMDSARVTLKNLSIRYAEQGAPARPYPTVLMYRATDVAVEELSIRDSVGVPLLAQRSRNIAVRGGDVPADGALFSDCGGLVEMQGAAAPRVHTTRMGIERVESPQVIMVTHPQESGYELLRPGERIQFATNKAPHPTLGLVAAVERLDETHLRITLSAPLPAGIGTGDFIRNADWQPPATAEFNTALPNP